MRHPCCRLCVFEVENEWKLTARSYSERLEFQILTRTPISSPFPRAPSVRVLSIHFSVQPMSSDEEQHDLMCNPWIHNVFKENSEECRIGSQRLAALVRQHRTPLGPGKTTAICHDAADLIEYLLDRLAKSEKMQAEAVRLRDAEELWHITQLEYLHKASDEMLAKKDAEIAQLKAKIPNYYYHPHQKPVISLRKSITWEHSRCDPADHYTSKDIMLDVGTSTTFYVCAGFCIREAARSIHKHFARQLAWVAIYKQLIEANK